VKEAPEERHQPPAHHYKYCYCYCN